jgi:hypothetical protein
MNDTEMLDRAKRCLEVARLAECHAVLTVYELAWLIEQVEERATSLAYIYGDEKEATLVGGRCLFRSLMETGADDADLTEEGEE